MTHRARGFTLIEVVVVITILVVLYTVFLERAWVYQEQAEKTAMVEVVEAIQSALVLKYGHMMVRGAESEAGVLATENPMTWLAKQPRNYAGEFYDPTPLSISPGNWMFDLKAHQLIYMPSRTDNFVAGPDGQKWIRYRVNLVYDPPASAQPGKMLVGTLFEPVAPYRWLGN
ncbi:MAG: prepilin-type N-terminal cleavage/methylation domain-containing protein [Pseudomonadota bacterium]